MATTSRLRQTFNSSAYMIEERESKLIREKLKKNVGIVLDKPMHPEFAVLNARLRTFKNWPSFCPVRPEILSECGFIYEGVKDRVKCFHCSTEIENWSADMDPWITHALKFGFCAHVRQCKGDDFILRIHGEAVTEVNCTNNVDLSVEKNKDAIEAAKSIFAIDDDQVRTAVKVFLDRNISVFSGTELVNMIERLEDIESASTPAPVTDPDTQYEVLSIDALAEEVKRLKSTYLCKVCFEGYANMVIIPCGHLCSCWQCISALKNCPICREERQGTVRATLI